MVKKTKAERKAQKAAALKETCLHCVFFEVHQDKWPDWRADGDNVDQTAFNDLVRSAVKIVAEVFSMLEPVGQLTFMRRVMQHYGDIAKENSDDKMPTLSEMIDIIRSQINTKH
jgi:hypothetical protein